MYTRNQKNANERRVVFLSHFKEEASSEARLLKMMLLQEMAEHGVSNNDIFLDSDNLHKITELLQEVKRTDNLVVLLTKRLLTRPWCLLELWAAHQNGVNIVPVKIECRGATRLFEFGPSAEAFKNDLASQVDQTCIEQIVQHGAMVTEIQVAIAELLDSIAVNFNVDASERQQKAQVLDMIDRFRTAQSSEAKEEEKAPAEAAAAEMAAIELREAEQSAVTPEAFHKHCEGGQAAEVAAALEAARGDPERLRALLEHRDSYTYTPLHHAAARGQGEVVRLLLGAGADRDARNKEGMTPMHLAARNGQGEVVRLLLEAGADRDARTNGGDTPMHRAVRSGHGEVVRLLLEAGADRDARDNDGRTPMHWAAHWGRGEMVRLLLGAGADRDARTNAGSTPMHLAAHWGRGEVVRLLLEAGADRDARENNGDTPMHKAQNPYGSANKDGCAAIIEMLS